MKRIAKKIPIALLGVLYECDLILAIYATKENRPVLILQESNPQNGAGFTETLTIASENPPEGFLTGHPGPLVVLNNWSENEGLEAQLLPLKDSEGVPLLSRTLDRHHQPLSLTLGFCKAHVYTLQGEAAAAYAELLEDLS